MKTRYLWKKERRRNISSLEKVKVELKHAPIYVELFKMVEGLDDKEEEQLLRDNQDFTPSSCYR